VLYVGRLATGKGLEYLVEASAQVYPSHVLVVAGDGPLLPSLHDRAQSAGVSECVSFIGRVTQTELPALLQASDVFVLPSVSTPTFREPWGLVVNEAMNSGLPVVATDAVGAAAGGLIVPEETGHVVPQRDVRALAAAIEDLVNDPARRRRMGEAGKERVRGWNYDAAADAFEQALSNAVRR
jgi:glycosyltransferase involved in cell wall biosynthesis